MIYEVQQTQSQCPQCSRLRRHPNDSSSQSSQSEHKIVIPLNKYLVQNHQQYQRTLNILQEEVERLKKQNEQKQKKIKKLEAQMNKKQLRFYPQNAKVGSIYENQTQSNIRNPKSRRHNTEYYYEDVHQSIPKKTKAQKYPSAKALKEVSEIEKGIKEMNDNKNDRIYQLQVQLSRIGQKYEQIQRKLEEQIKDNEWLMKFCLSFVKMAGQISSLQGKNIIQPTASLRKNTKIAWKFFKTFIKEVIE